MACVVAGISRIERGQGCSGDARLRPQKAVLSCISASMIHGRAVQFLDANWCHILRAVTGVRQCLASVHAWTKRARGAAVAHDGPRSLPGVVHIVWTALGAAAATVGVERRRLQSHGNSARFRCQSADAEPN